MNTSLLSVNLTEAPNDVYHARALYHKVIQVFGPVGPFVHMIEAEQHRIEALLPLFERYGVPISQDHWEVQVQPPASLVEACWVWARMVAGVADGGNAEETVSRAARMKRGQWMIT